MASKKKVSRPRSKRTGKFVSASYAKRYPHLVKGGKKPSRPSAPKPPRRRPPAPPPPPPREPLLPPGAELEVTATTKGGTPRRDKRGGRRMDPNVLSVKVYMTLNRPMTFPQAQRIAYRAMMAASWDRRDITVEYMDWLKGRRVGRYQFHQRVDDALVAFRHALQQSEIRIALVD